ncbi:MAG: PKD domain-containing protein [Bacteroidota bacterium]
MRKIILLLCFAFPLAGFAQFSISRTLGSASTENYGQDLRFDSDSTLTVLGYVLSSIPNAQNNDFYFTQLDRNNNVKKTVLIGDSLFESGRAHLVDYAGNYLLAGSRRSYLFSSNNVGQIVKLDANWNILWAKSIVLGAYNTEVNFCKQLKDSSYLIGGVTNTVFSDSKGWLCKMNVQGTVIWCKTYSRNACGFNSVDEDALGNLYVTGFQTVGSSASTALKLNSSGGLMWDGSVVGWYYLNGKLGKDGHFYVVGHTGFNSGDAILIQKYNSSTGARLWTKKYNEYMGHYMGFDLCFDTKGYLYLLGSGTSSGIGTHLLKMDTTGNLAWHVIIKPSNTIASKADNQSIQYDPNTNKLWISATGNLYSHESYVFLLDTGIAGNTCLFTKNFPVDTSTSTNQGGGDTITVIATVTPSIQSLPDVAVRTTSIVSAISCASCKSAVPNFTFQYLDSITVKFNNTSDTTLGHSFKWSFGDGDTSAINNPVHVFKTKGTFQVKLRATSASGLCRDSITKQVKIEGKPVAKYSVTNGCQNTYITFSNQSTVSPGTLVKYWWYFGNGDTSTLLSPSHFYHTAGLYQVKLVIETETGRMDSSTKTIQVYPKPDAEFNSSLPCEKDTITYTQTSTVASGSIISALWTFGTKNMGGLSVKTVFTDTGNYTARLICSTDKSCKDTITKTIRVFPKPRVGFTVVGALSQCLPSNQFTFTDTTKFSGIGLTGFWMTSSDTTTTNVYIKSYSSAGSFIIKRLAISTDGCKDSASKTVKVFAKPTTPAITGEAFPKINSVKKYTVLHKPGSTYQWFITGGIVVSAQGKDSIQIQWSASPRAGWLAVMETDSNGCISDTAKLVTLVGVNQLVLTPDTIMAGPSGLSSGVISVQTDTSWLANSSHGWITIGNPTGIGNANLFFVIDTNAGTKREGYIEVVAGLIHKQVFISQKGPTLGSYDLDYDKQSIQVYPNPGNDLFTIDFKHINTTKEIRIADMCGKLVYTSQTTQHSYTFSLRHLPKGIYFLSVDSGKNMFHTKLLLSE